MKSCCYALNYRTTTKGPKTIVILAPLFQLNHLHNGQLHKRLKVACIESQSIVVEDKQNFFFLSSACFCEGSFGVSFKLMLCVQTHALHVNGIVGRDTRELCHLGHFVVVRQ